MPERRKVFKKGLAVPGHALRAFPVLPSRAAFVIAESGNQAPTAAECASEAANEQSVRRGAIRTFGQGENRAISGAKRPFATHPLPELGTLSNRDLTGVSPLNTAFPWCCETGQTKNS